MTENEITFDNSPRAIWRRIYLELFEPVLVPMNGWRDLRWAATWLAVLIVIRIDLPASWLHARAALAIAIGMLGASLLSYLFVFAQAARGWRGEA